MNLQQIIQFKAALIHDLLRWIIPLGQFNLVHGILFDFSERVLNFYRDRIFSYPMRSVEFRFGTDQESDAEGKGIDWMLDPFLQKKITGQGGFDYEIVQTRPDLVIQMLNEKYNHPNPSKLMESNAFYTILLSMNVKMNDPNIWSLSWARFEFEIDEANASVLSFAPNIEGVKTTIEKNSSRELNLTLSGELSLPAPIGTRINPDIAYDKKNGWTVKFDTNVEEVKGFKTRSTNGRINLQWDIYRNKAIEIPENNIGETSGAFACALISIPKHSQTSINVKISGETERRGTSVRSRGIIEHASRATFRLEPTL